MDLDTDITTQEGIGELPKNLFILPLPIKPLFPGLFTPLMVTGANDIALINQAMSRGGIIGTLLERPHNDDDAIKGLDDRFYMVGTACKIIKVLRLPDGGLNLYVSTLSRFKVVSFFGGDTYIGAQIEPLADEENNPERLKAWLRALNDEFQKMNRKMQLFSEENRLNMVNIEDPGRFADYMASILNIEGEKLQEILETLNVKKRIETVLFYIAQERKIAEVQAHIQETVNKKLEKNQRDYFLKEELKHIQKQLGGGGGKEDVISKFKSKIEALNLEGEAKESVMEELEHFSTLEQNSADYSISFAYLETVCALPWKEEPFQDYDISEVRRVLENDHYGMQDVKDRILEFFAVRKQKKDVKGAIICLCGPPGVGKTSVGESIARALGKKYYRFSVGGMKDEAEIKGHRRTYVGALPGKIIQGLKITHTKSPLFLIDEIDKMGQSLQGDPASALLEALDPEQNKAFRDRYLDLPFDISEVLFIVTANSLEGVPAPLLDRMEIIELSGYTSNEKIHIAKKYLLPKSFDKHGLEKGSVKYSQRTLLTIAEQYCREAGVRHFEKSLDKINRKIVLEHFENPDFMFPVTVSSALVEKYLGKPIFPADDIVRADKAGTALGLAWTSMGGDVLLIEAENYPGKGELNITGQLGDVMKESVSIAWTCLKREAERRDIDRSWFEKNNVHLHVPEGATPKDGPSAGITLLTALYSLLTNQVIKEDLAMTGELTLTGKVMPIGGLKEKLLAAKRNRVKTVIFPKKNLRDWDKLSDEIKEGLDAHPVEDMLEVLRIAFPSDKRERMDEDEYRKKIALESEREKSESKEKDQRVVKILELLSGAQNGSKA